MKVRIVWLALFALIGIEIEANLHLIKTYIVRHSQTEQNPSQQKDDRSGNNQPTAGNAGQTLMPAQREPVGQISQPKPNGQYGDARENQQASVTDRIAAPLQEINFGNFINTMLTVALLWVGYQQLRTYRQQARLMDGQLQAAVIASEASRRQAEIAERAFVGLERPYLLIEHLTYGTRRTGSFEPGYEHMQQGGPNRVWFSTELSISIKNHGKTPAFVKSVQFEMIYRLILPDGNFEQTGGRANLEMIGAIASGGIYTTQPRFIHTLAIAKSEPENVLLTNTLFLKGTIAYSDVFRRVWVRYFIYKLHPSGDTLPAEDDGNYERDAVQT